jgi:hypothetical protein
VNLPQQVGERSQIDCGGVHFLCPSRKLLAASSRARSSTGSTQAGWPPTTAVFTVILVSGLSDQPHLLTRKSSNALIEPPMARE